VAHRSSRCARCDLNLPKSYTNCPVCHTETFEHDQTWDQGWTKEAERLKKRRFQEATGLIPNAMATVVEKDGLLFVAEDYLHRAGYNPQDLDVVKINGKFYELVGRVGDDEITGWWLEPVDVEAEVARLTEQHPVLTETEYQALERQRGIRE